MKSQRKKKWPKGNQDKPNDADAEAEPDAPEERASTQCLMA